MGRIARNMVWKYKCKIKYLSLCITNKALCHEGVWGRVDVQIHVFLTSALIGGEWPGSRPDRFTPEEKPPVSVG
jgi:hypothetical protein